MTTPTPFQWAAQPSALAAQFAVKVNRNPRPVPITYSRFRKAGGVA